MPTDDPADVAERVLRPPEARGIPDADERGHLVYVLSGHLALWHRAVMVQRDRVLNTDEAHALDRQMDAMQFVIALRNFVRAVEAIQALGGAQSGKALGAFTEAVPRWKHVRDVIEHFDRSRRQRLLPTRCCTSPYTTPTC